MGRGCLCGHGGFLPQSRPPLALGLELLESREQSPRVLRAVVVLCVAKGPAQGFVAEKARNRLMGPT